MTEIYGRLTVLKRFRKNGRGYCRCCCECGAVKNIRSDHLIRKLKPVVSCGCYNREKARTQGTHHGTATDEYRVWQSMKKRCLNKNSTDYASYGGKGISICARWLNSFPNFLSDMGTRPSSAHSIDRIDNAKGYSPENCRWATSSDQANNRKNNILLTFRGETKTVAQWCTILGVNYYLVYQRITDLGWDAEKALTAPTRGVS